jgi:hypothetical protein
VRKKKRGLRQQREFPTEYAALDAHSGCGVHVHGVRSFCSSHQQIDFAIPFVGVVLRALRMMMMLALALAKEIHGE